MNVNSVMSNYNMSSLWNSINPTNNRTSSNVPLVGNVDSTVNESYTSKDFFGETSNDLLRDIYSSVEPNLGIPLTYDKNGNFVMDSSSTSDTTSDNLMGSILSQYTSIENGTFKSNLSSILSNNPYSMYSSINSLTNNQTQRGNSVNELV